LFQSHFSKISIVIIWNKRLDLGLVFLVSEIPNGVLCSSHIIIIIIITIIVLSVSDMDTIWVGVSDSIWSGLGVDNADTTSTQNCKWCLEDGSSYIAPGVMLNFPPHSPLLTHAFQSAFDPQLYDPHCWGCVGPYPITRAVQNAMKNQNLQDQVSNKERYISC